MTAAQDRQIWRKLSANVSIRSPPPPNDQNGQGIDDDDDEGKH